MTTYNASKPQPTDFLSNSQQDLLNNFSSANISIGIDHYPFDDDTANNGKHNMVTTPIIIGGEPPTTAANEPKFYALTPPNSNDPYTAIGTLQWSRGGSDAVPTPLTTLQSPAGGISINSDDTTNILDFSGISLAYFNVYSVALFSGGTTVIVETYGYWNGSIFVLTNFARGASSGSGTGLNVVSSTSFLQLENSSSSSASNVYWTLQFFRIV
jgi:hypothetical protein